MAETQAERDSRIEQERRRRTAPPVDLFNDNLTEEERIANFKAREASRGAVPPRDRAPLDAPRNTRVEDLAREDVIVNQPAEAVAREDVIANRRPEAVAREDVLVNQMAANRPPANRRPANGFNGTFTPPPTQLTSTEGAEPSEERQQFFRTSFANQAERQAERTATEAALAEAETPGEVGQIRGQATREALTAPFEAGAAATIDVSRAAIESDVTRGTFGFMRGFFTSPPSETDDEPDPTGTEPVIEQGDANAADELGAQENAVDQVRPDVAPGTLEFEEDSRTDIDTPQSTSGSNQEAASGGDNVLGQQLDEPPLETVDVIRGTRQTQDVPGFSDSDLAGLRLPVGFSREKQIELAAHRNFGLSAEDSIKAVQDRRAVEAQLINAGANADRARNAALVSVPLANGNMGFTFLNEDNELVLLDSQTASPLTDNVMTLSEPVSVPDGLGGFDTARNEYAIEIFLGPNGELMQKRLGIDVAQQNINTAMQHRDWVTIFTEAMGQTGGDVEAAFALAVESLAGAAATR